MVIIYLDLFRIALSIFHSSIYLENVGIDGDDPTHVQWIFEKAQDRADQYGIKGVTYRLTQGECNSSCRASARLCNIMFKNVQDLSNGCILTLLQKKSCCSFDPFNYKFFSSGKYFNSKGNAHLKVEARFVKVRYKYLSHSSSL